jgi:hypothetical protein
VELRFSFSAGAEEFRQRLTNPEDYAQLVVDLDELAANPAVDGVHVFDHPEGRVAWTPRFRIVFSPGSPGLAIHSIVRRGIVPRADEPPDA